MGTKLNYIKVIELIFKFPNDAYLCMECMLYVITVMLDKSRRA